MNIAEFKSKISNLPESEKIDFSETMAVVDSLYDFTPTEFKNGETINEANQNNGSCKLFALAKLQGFSKDETLACFGQYYRDDVLGNPDGDDHQNIRNFMKFGWDGVVFKGDALSLK